MADYTSTFQQKAKQKIGSDPGSWVETLARFGYIAKGVVYATVGVLALDAAFSSGQTTGSQGAIQQIGQQPFGRILLGLIAVGLLGYVVWRFTQAFIDPDHKGTDAEGVVMRIGYAVSGAIYTFLALTAGRMALTNGSGGGGSQQEWTAQLLAQPFGQWLVGLIGAIVIGVAVRHFYRAYKASFMEKYKTREMNAHERTWARRTGRFGLSARGVTFLIIGFFLIRAAQTTSSGEARGLGGALQTLADQPYGPWILALVALGFVAYGIFCFSKARYRTFSV